MDEHTMRKETEKAKRWNTVIFWIFAAIFAALIAAVCVFMYQHTYSAAKWNADRENRHKIAGDMLRQNQLVGMTEAEVIELLGSEDSNGPTSFKISNKKYFPPESTLVYYLGVDFIDTNWLVISLDGGIVTEYYIDVT